MGSRPGLEVVHPMAVVILGGLVTTTFLSLFVLPALYLRYAAPAEPGLAARGGADAQVGRGRARGRGGARGCGAATATRCLRRTAAAAGHRRGEGDGIVRTLHGKRLRALAAGLVVVGAMSLSACKEVEEESAAGYEPAKLEPIKGKSEDFQRVTFTKEGAARVGPPDGDGAAAAASTRSSPTRR